MRSSKIKDQLEEPEQYSGKQEEVMLSEQSLRVNKPLYKKVLQNGGDCLCKDGVSCPCGEPLLLATGNTDKEACTCNVFYLAEKEES